MNLWASSNFSSHSLALASDSNLATSAKAAASSEAILAFSAFLVAASVVSFALRSGSGSSPKCCANSFAALFLCTTPRL
jgi:hypothetical protein